MTSSILWIGTLDFLIVSFAQIEPSSTAGTSDKLPKNWPIGVRILPQSTIEHIPISKYQEKTDALYGREFRDCR